jgi:DNA-binding NarL/FixJ family response regulator
VGRPRGFVCSAETRARMSAGHLGYVPTSETRAKISASNRGRVRTLEAQEKTAAAHRGKKLSPETRAKIGAAQRPRKRTPEAIIKAIELLTDGLTRIEVAKRLGVSSATVTQMVADHKRARKRSANLD